MRALRLNARNSRMVKDRFGVLDGVVRGAASVDTAVAAMVRRIQTEFYEKPAAGGRGSSRRARSSPRWT